MGYSYKQIKKEVNEFLWVYNLSFQKAISILAAATVLLPSIPKIMFFSTNKLKDRMALEDFRQGDIYPEHRIVYRPEGFYREGKNNLLTRLDCLTQ